MTLLTSWLLPNNSWLVTLSHYSQSWVMTITSMTCSDQPIKSLIYALINDLIDWSQKYVEYAAQMLEKHGAKAWRKIKNKIMIEIMNITSFTIIKKPWSWSETFLCQVNPIYFTPCVLCSKHPFSLNLNFLFQTSSFSLKKHKTV